MADFRINVIVDPGPAAAGARRVGRSLDGLENRANRLRAAFARAFGLLAGGAGIIGSVRVLAQFEQAMSTVQAITQATGRDFDALTAKAQELGAVTRFSATQAAEGMVSLARAGFNADQVLASIAGTLQLAQAGALDLGQAADIATNVLTGFQLEVSEIARVVDVLALGANSANTDVRGFGESLKFVAPVAAGLKIPLEEAAAAVQALANAGLKGGLGGRGLRGLIAELQSPSDVLGEFLEKAGVEVDNFSVSTLGLVGSVEALSAAGVTAENVFGLLENSAATAFLALTGQSEDLPRFIENLENAEGAAARIAAVMDDNLNGALLQVRSAFEAIIISVGQSGAGGALEGFFRSLASGLRTLAANADTLIRVAESLAIVFSVRLAQQAIPFLIARLNLLRVALLTNPLGILAVALTAAIGLLFTFRDEITLSTDSATTLGDVMTETFALVGDALRELGVVFDEIFTPLVDLAEEALGGVELTFRDVLLFFAVFRDTAVGIFGGLFDGLVAVFPTLPEAIASGVLSALNFMISGVENAIDGIRAIFASVGQFFSTIIFAITSSFNLLGQATRQAFNDPAQAARLADEAAEVFKNNFERAFTQFPESIGKNLLRFQKEDLIPTVDNPFEGAGADAADAFADAFQKRSGESAGQDLLIEIFRRADDRSAARQRARALAGQNADGAGAGTPAAPGAGAGGDEDANAGAAASIASVNAELDREIMLLGLGSRERERRNELLRIEDELGRMLTDTERGQLDAKLANLQATQDQANVLEEIRGPQQDLIDRQAAANALFEQGKITLEEYNAVLRDTAIAAAEAGTSLLDGFVEGLLKAERALSDVSGLAAGAVQNAFGGLEDAFVSLATTGQISFKGLVDSVLADLARLLARQAISGLISLLGSAFGGAGGAAGGLLTSLLARQGGGPVQAGTPFLVGENGPEIFTPPGGGNIIPAERSAAIMGGGQQAAPTVNVAPAQVNVNVVNVSDPDEIPRGIESDDGAVAVMNVIGKNKNQIRGLIA